MTELPQDWRPTERDKEYAQVWGLNVIAVAEMFRNYHTGKGTRMVDWGAAWRVWCQREAQQGGKTINHQGQIVSPGSGF
jgi:hypothetical protein